MAGHNKWSKVKHVKGAADAKKGKLFTKIAKEIIVASRIAGGDPATNPRLRAAVQTARENSMPKDNIERAIKKGTGELQAEVLEECLYEGYGPGGVAVLVEATTDNKNRTVSDLRRIFKSGGGNLGESGSVMWMFDKCGQLLFDGEKNKEETIMEVALEAGATDISGAGEVIEVVTDSTEVYKVKEGFDKVGIHPTSSGFAYVPKNTTKVDDSEVAEKLLRMLQELDEHDDVSKVHSNFDMDDELLTKIQATLAS